MNNIVSITTASALTGQSERTLRRRIADGILARTVDATGSNRTMIPFEAIKEQLVVPIGSDDIELIRDADAGNAESQNDLALLFLSHNKPEGAMYWLELAAKQEHPDAMHWLARAYLEGKGVVKDENRGLMWLSKAAAHGHVISQAQMQALRDKVLGKI